MSSKNTPANKSGEYLVPLLENLKNGQIITLRIQSDLVDDHIDVKVIYDGFCKKRKDGLILMGVKEIKDLKHLTDKTSTREART